MIKKEIVHPVLGRITYIKRIGNSHIRITINPSKGIIVSLPPFSSYSAAQIFVDSNIEQIQRIKEKQRKNQKDRYNAYGINNLIETLSFRISFAKYNSSKVVAKIITDIVSGEQKQIITIWYPDTWPDSLQYDSKEWKAINYVYLAIIRREAKSVLPLRTAKIAALMEERVKSFNSSSGLLPHKPRSLNMLLFSDENERSYFKFNTITIKNNKTNWGSCSTKNNINLNMHLVELKEELVDFVITHELCHLVYHNHSKNFHRLLNEFCGGREKEISLLLRQHRMN